MSYEFGFKFELFPSYIEISQSFSQAVYMCHTGRSSLVIPSLIKHQTFHPRASVELTRKMRMFETIGLTTFEQIERKAAEVAKRFTFSRISGEA